MDRIVSIHGFPSYKPPFSYGLYSHNQRVNIHFPMVFPWFSYGFLWKPPYIYHTTIPGSQRFRRGRRSAWAARTPGMRQRASPAPGW